MPSIIDITKNHLEISHTKKWTDSAKEWLKGGLALAGLGVMGFLTHLLSGRFAAKMMEPASVNSNQLNLIETTTDQQGLHVLKRNQDFSPFSSFEFSHQETKISSTETTDQEELVYLEPTYSNGFQAPQQKTLTETPTIIYPAKIQPTDLNAMNSFTFNGKNVNDQAGSTVNGIPDINDDGYAELGLNLAGEVGIVYGGPTISDQGILTSSNLNGMNGFTTTGLVWSFNNYGSNLCGVKNFTGDGRNGFVMGNRDLTSSTLTNSYTYVVLSNLNMGANGLFNLTASHSNAYQFKPAFYYDWSGLSVAAGDINNDNLQDIIVGVPYTDLNLAIGSIDLLCGGTSYANVNLLNAASNFTMLGQTRQGRLGTSVSVVMKFNDDDYPDILIGEPGNNSAYLIYGSPTLCNQGAFALSALNGTNGFKLSSTIDSFGFTVTAGNIFGNGRDALVIGAPAEIGSPPKTYVYVIQYTPTIGQGGVFFVDAATNTNVYKISANGLYTNSLTIGFSPIGIGDVNADGKDDIFIGQCLGAAQVVFGGMTTNIDLSTSLNGENGFMIDSGHYGDSGYTCLTTILASGDVNGDGVSDIIMGVPNSSVNNVVQAGLVNVLFSASPALASSALINNQLTIFNGETLTINNTHFSATIPGYNASNIQFSIYELSGGRFQIAGSSVTSFTQAQVNMGQVLFIHNGNGVVPTYNTSLSLQNSLAYTKPVAASTILIAAPTATPTLAPTATPTSAPTLVPTAMPTLVPTAAPTPIPTIAPTLPPTATPTAAPTIAPTLSPTLQPTLAPTSLNNTGNTTAPIPPLTPSSQNNNNSAFFTVSVGASLGGSIVLVVLALFGLRFSATRQTQKKLQKCIKVKSMQEGENVSNDDGFRQMVLQPIAENIFKKIQLTGLLSMRTDQIEKYLLAIENMIRLFENNLPRKLISLSEEEKEFLFNLIVDKTKLILAPTSALARFTRIFPCSKPIFMPEQLELYKQKITDAILAELEPGSHLAAILYNESPQNSSVVPSAPLGEFGYELKNMTSSPSAPPDSARNLFSVANTYDAVLLPFTEEMKVDGSDNYRSNVLSS